MYQTKALMSTAASKNRRVDHAETSPSGYRSCGFRRPFRWDHASDMSHFAPGAGGALAIEVDGRAGNGEPFPIAVDLVADQVGHGDLAMAARLAERPPGNGADVLFELRDRCTVERPVP